MKCFKSAFVFCFAVVAVMPAFAAEAAPAADAGVNNDKLLYSLGYLMGENVKKQLILDRGEEDSKAISQGMRDAMLDRKPQTDLETYKPLIAKRYEDDAAKKLAARKIEQDKVLQDIKKEKNVKTLPDGMLIRTVKNGKGASPKPTSMVKVHYEGALLDGTVFDSSIKRNAPATFPLNGVIPCWTEGLQKMKAGGKAKLYCPPNTAYGDAQAGLIPPGSLLIFDVELLEVNN
ncbi:MAG: FKBP-type peptidyl-prolyl cis-trans isomerase [Elusimicrobiota bacterium]|jgi:FKBP-type peptidyl-prolyl cis-trans isomerase|nr:FKBP-type peptidyl-prolyl cis-trans isomerase [Elusimicrobiota bacterium]